MRMPTMSAVLTALSASACAHRLSALQGFLCKVISNVLFVLAQVLQVLQEYYGIKAAGVLGLNMLESLLGASEVLDALVRPFGDQRTSRWMQQSIWHGGSTTCITCSLNLVWLNKNVVALPFAVL